jgi:hypothetical protein
MPSRIVTLLIKDVEPAYSVSPSHNASKWWISSQPHTWWMLWAAGDEQ